MAQLFSYWHSVRYHGGNGLSRPTFVKANHRCNAAVAAVREAQARQRAASSDDRRPYPRRGIAGGHRPPLQLVIAMLLVSGVLYAQGQPAVEKISPDVRTIQDAVNKVVGTPVPGGGVLQVAKGAYLDGYGIVVSLEVAFAPPVNPFSPQKTPEEIRTTAAQQLKEVQEKLTNVLKQKAAQLESVAPAESVSVVLNILNTNPAYLPDMPSQIIFSVKKQDTARVSLRQYK